MTRRRSRGIDARSTDSQRLYEPNFAWKSAASVLRGLPGLRGAWTMGSFDENGDQFDVSGQGRTLGYQGNPLYNCTGLVPYLDMDGTGDYLNRADEAGLDITGAVATEPYNDPSKLGLTLGLWFRPDRLTTWEFLIGKGTGVIAASSFWLVFRADIAGDPVRFVVCNGAARDDVNLIDVVDATGEWYFAAGRFEPSTETKVWVGHGGVLQSNTNAVGIPASVNNSAADFTIGAFSAATQHLEGQVSMAWLSCQYLEDVVVASIYQQTRAMFGE